MKKYGEEKESRRVPCEYSLPSTASALESVEMPAEKKYGGKDPFKVFSCILLFSLCFLLAVYFICGYFVENFFEERGSEQISVQTDTDKKQEFEWVGAFASRDISESCLAASVRIRLGAAGEYGARAASGVIVDEDGWIASSDSLLESGQKGRIYVLLNDGREYAVEKIVRAKEGKVAFMKIDAEDLTAVRLDNDINVCLGQKVMALGSEGAPKHNGVMSVGIVSGLIGEDILTDIAFWEASKGCPIFDESGRMLGLSIEGDGRVFLAKKLQETLKKIKGK